MGWNILYNKEIVNWNQYMECRTIQKNKNKLNKKMKKK